MTRNELVDLIYLNISSGKATTDLNIKRVDIKALLPLIISDAIMVFSRQTRKDEFEEIRIYGASNGETVNSQFLTTFKVTPVEDTDTGLYTVTLPKNVAVLPFSRGIDELRPLKGDSYTRVRSFSETIGLADFFTPFWFDNQGNVKKLYIRNIGLPVCEHFLKIVVDFNDMGDDDDLFLPAGLNLFVLKEARAYLLGEKEIPAEYKIDDKENRA